MNANEYLERAMGALVNDNIDQGIEDLTAAINQPRRRADGVWLVREEVYSTGGLLPRHHRQRIEPPQRLPAGRRVLGY
jgi:hypothetical protein